MTTILRGAAYDDPLHARGTLWKGQGVLNRPVFVTKRFRLSVWYSGICADGASFRPVLR